MGVLTLEQGTEENKEPDRGSGDFPAIPAGTQLLTEVLDVKYKEEGPFWVDPEDHALGKAPQVSFRFKVVEEGEYLNRQLFGNTPATFTTHPECKLRRWAEEIYDVDELPVDFAFSVDDETGKIEALEGGNVYIIVGNYKTKDTPPKVKDTVQDIKRLTETLPDPF